jgi:prepilin-type N-terminal cleavage/methylation domain-containing protein
MLRGSLVIFDRRGGTMQGIQEQRVRNRRGLTLVELLVTISIMATVTSMLVIAYRSAATEANNIRTQATIRKINEVLTARMQEYEQVRIEPSVFPTSGNIPPDARANTSLVAPQKQENTTILLQRARLFSLRQTIVQEMPDHPDDLKWGHKWFAGGTKTQVDAHIDNWLGFSHQVPTGLFASSLPAATPQIFAMTSISQRTRSLINRLTAIDPSNGNFVPLHSAKNGKPWEITEEPWEARNANAELLYLIIEDSQYNGSSAIELFGRSEIGDTDQDGLSEFIDSFGNPIRWIRWPSGSDISIRSHPDLMDPVFDGIDGNGDPVRMDVQGDPLDRSKADPGYAQYSTERQLIGLRPLVVSPGADRRFGIRMQIETPFSIGAPFPRNDTSYSLGDVPYGVSPQTDLPYSTSPVDCYAADPWYPRADVTLRLGAPRTNDSRAPFDNSIPLESDYYDVAQDALDNISNLDTAGGAL